MNIRESNSSDSEMEDDFRQKLHQRSYTPGGQPTTDNSMLTNIPQNPNDSAFIPPEGIFQQPNGQKVIYVPVHAPTQQSFYNNSQLTNYGEPYHQLQPISPPQLA